MIVDWAIEPDEAVAAMSLARLPAAVVRDDLGATGVNLRQNNGAAAGQDVFHFHLHVVPATRETRCSRAACGARAAVVAADRRRRRAPTRRRSGEPWPTEPGSAHSPTLGGK